MIPGFTLSGMDKRVFLRIGPLARQTGLSVDTLRHYERKGVLVARRSPSGYREYPLEAIDRVRLIQRALSVGFTLDELARVFRVRERGGAPCRAVRALAAAKLQSMEERICEALALRDQLRALIAKWDATLACTPKGQPAHLLETWPQAPVAARIPGTSTLVPRRARRSLGRAVRRGGVRTQTGGTR